MGNDILDRVFAELDALFMNLSFEGERGFAQIVSKRKEIYLEFKKFIRRKNNSLFSNNSLDWFVKFVISYFSQVFGIYPSKKPKETYQMVALDSSKVFFDWITSRHYYLETNFFRFQNRIIWHLDSSTKILFDTEDLRESFVSQKDIHFSVLQDETKDGSQINVRLHVTKGQKPSRKNEIKKLIGKLKATGTTFPITKLEMAIGSFLKIMQQELFIPKLPQKYLEKELRSWVASLLMNSTLSPEEVESFEIITHQFIKQFLPLINFMKDTLLRPRSISKQEYVISLKKLEELIGKEKTIAILGEANLEQILEEWKTLDFIDKDITICGISEMYPYLNKNLPIDTALLDERTSIHLKDLLGKMETNLDGWLIHSENLQALNTFRESFQRSVQTVFIDPPFNLGGTDKFDYKTSYENSTWLTLIENRVSMAMDFLKEDGTFFLRCDHNGNMLARMVLDRLFDEKNFRNELIIKRIVKKGFNSNRFPTATDSLFFYSKNRRYYFKGFKKKLEKKRPSYWHDMTSMNKTSKGGKPRIIFGAKIYPPHRRGWTFSQEKIEQMEREGRVRIRCANCRYIHTSGNWKGCPECGENIPKVDYLIPERDEEPLDSNWTDIKGYSSKWDFQTENAEDVLKRVILSTTRPKDIVMDFFAGSGTTGAVAQKLGRRWISIEKGEHCLSVILPRMKKVLFYDPSGISKEIHKIYNKDNAGGFFKYIVLEDYEEALDQSFLE